MADFTIAALDGMLPSALALTLDVLSSAAQCAQAAGARPPTWRLVAPAGSADLGLGLNVRAERLGPRTRLGRSVLVIPGLRLLPPQHARSADIDGAYLARRLAEPDARCLAQLARAHRARGGIVAASCASVLLLGDAGLLDGRHATTHWRLAELLRARHPRCALDTRRMVIDDGGVITAGAAMAQMDLMLLLVARHCGRAIADRVMRYLLLDERPTQATYAVPTQLASHDGLVGGLERMVEQHLPQPLSIEALAQRLHVSSRTLARRVRAATGQSPKAFVQAVRLRRARHLLETTTLPVSEVASRVGYSDHSGLHRLARTWMQESPGGLRERR
jgi:transcriptional regulator GlxA family with amidase domain